MGCDSPLAHRAIIILYNQVRLKAQAFYYFYYYER